MSARAAIANTNRRQRLHRTMIAELKKFFGEELCATTVPRNIRLVQAPKSWKPALVHHLRLEGRGDT